MCSLKHLFLGIIFLSVIDTIKASEELQEESCWSFISKVLSDFIDKFDGEESSNLNFEDSVEEEKIEQGTSIELGIMWGTETPRNASDNMENLRAELDNKLHDYGRSALALEKFDKRIECIEGAVAIFCNHAIITHRDKLEKTKSRRQESLQGTIESLIRESTPFKEKTYLARECSTNCFND